jgi:hypothetical protein
MNTSVSLELDRLLLEKNIPMPVNPTIAEVVMWLYEKHGIWVSVHEENCRGYVGFDFNIVFVGDHEITVTQQEIQYKLLGETVFNSPTEAYEAGIEYVLNNLLIFTNK